MSVVEVGQVWRGAFMENFGDTCLCVKVVPGNGDWLVATFVDLDDGYVGPVRIDPDYWKDPAARENGRMRVM